MKCSDCQKLLPLYLENESELAERQSIQAHVQSCVACRTMLHALEGEADAIAEAIGLQKLPDSFARSLLDQLEPYPAQQQLHVQEIPPAPPRMRRNTHWKRAVVAACAVIFLGIAAGTFISPAFAAYVSSFIDRIGGELGLKRAAEQGYGIPVNQTVTDQGITLRIKDIVADPARLVISYVLEDETGAVLPNLFVPAYDGNRVYLTDEAGTMINESPDVFSQGTGYADYMFMLKKPPNHLVVHFELASLKPASDKQGSWKLDIPVDLTKSMQASAYIPIEESYSSSYGIDFTLEEVTYGPSATRFTLATRQTPEEKKRVEEITEQIVGPNKDKDSISLGSYSLQYHIEDKDGRIVAGQEDPLPSENRHVYFTPGYSSPPESDGDDTWRWYGAIVPSEKPEELWFVLESIEKTEPADFSIAFRPSDLAKAPVTKSYEAASSAFTITKMAQGTDPETNEPVWLITLSGELLESDFPKWRLQDESGHIYDLQTDYSVSSISGNEDGAVLDQTLVLKGLSSLPEKLTLSMLTIQKRYSDVNWKVAIPPNRS